MIVLPFYCNLHLIHTFHFHLKYDYSVLKHISPVPSNYREMKITGSSRLQEGCREPLAAGSPAHKPPWGQRGGTEEKWGLWRAWGGNPNGEKVGDRAQEAGREGTHGGGEGGGRVYLLRARVRLRSPYKFIILAQGPPFISYISGS